MPRVEREGRNAYMKEYRSRASSKYSYHSWHVKKKFGIGSEFYDEMLVKQGGVCAICGKLEPCGRALAVDHDHKTGKIRGLLCSNCNQGLGRFRDDASLIVRALTYILDHEGAA